MDTTIRTNDFDPDDPEQVKKAMALLKAKGRNSYEYLSRPLSRVCPTCGSVFETIGRGRPKRFCSDECRLAYLNASKHMENMAPERVATMDFRINVRPSSIKMSRDYNGIRWDENIENRKSSTRCKVEHPFLIVKRQFGYCKAVYKGLAKNMNRFNILFACANLIMCIRAGRTEAFCMG